MFTGNKDGKTGSNSSAIAAVRSVGHAVATAYMARSLDAAWYAFKAVKNAGKSVDIEIKW